MELDFTKLNKLSVLDFAEGAGKKQPPTSPTSPTEPRKGSGEYKNPTEPEKPLQGNLEGIGKLQREADQRKREIDETARIYREYQHNIKLSGQLQTEILKGARAGEDIYSLFLKAVQAISCMTSNKTFYSQVEADLISIYGIGLQQPAPLKLELMDTQKRLDRLREAEQREPNIDSIKRAITAHQNRIAELEKQIAKAQDKPA